LRLSSLTSSKSFSISLRLDGLIQVYESKRPAGVGVGIGVGVGVGTGMGSSLLFFGLIFPSTAASIASQQAS
jgi:hypothetical protein